MNALVLPMQVEIAVSMEVLVTFNVSTDLDVANGTRGHVVDIVQSRCSRDISTNPTHTLELYYSRLPPKRYPSVSPEGYRFSRSIEFDRDQNMRPKKARICTLHSSSILGMNVSLFMMVIRRYFGILHVLHILRACSPCE